MQATSSSNNSTGRPTNKRNIFGGKKAAQNDFSERPSDTKSTDDLRQTI